MELDELINEIIFLHNMPDPDEEDVSDELWERYVQVVSAIGDNPTKYLNLSIIEPVMGLFGVGTGHGTYFAFVHFLEKFDTSALLPVIEKMVVNPNAKRGSRLWSLRMLLRIINVDSKLEYVNLVKMCCDDSDPLICSEAQEIVDWVEKRE